MERMDYFIELYGGLPRGGPGDNASTRKAFEMMEHLPPEPKILDIGCGPGMQTIELLRLSGGTVVALDLLPQMISRVKQSADSEGFADRLEAVQADMNDMRFEPASFDVIWSEGAIYFLGFEKGLEKVKEFVKPGGYVAVSEAVWLEPDRPQEVADLWKEYPEIDTVERKLEVVSKLGYSIVNHFVLPASSWTELYYDPLAKRITEYENKWNGIPEAEDVLAEARNEISVFRKHSRCYSYAFFVMRK
ncbi:MAG: class I SAM-dependent methyltransferase [Planctomycetes bacterium]|nr:class I SAM-dependent methyltransferase [Planctomycetota bacterium]MBL7037596.1 class I SAM-dependent methyltransferase [Pirellulaceae bacterium]